MPLFKNVNGVDVQLSAEEEAALLAEWEAAAIERAKIKPAQVIAERERRLQLGFNYDFGDARGVHHIGTTTQDMIGWDEVTKVTQAMISLGAGNTTVSIATDTASANVTALEWQQVLLAAAQYRQPIWLGSFALQAMDPIPTDYASNNAYWGG